MTAFPEVYRAGQGRWPYSRKRVQFTVLASGKADIMKSGLWKDESHRLQSDTRDHLYLRVKAEEVGRV